MVSCENHCYMEVMTRGATLSSLCKEPLGQPSQSHMHGVSVAAMQPMQPNHEQQTVTRCGLASDCQFKSRPKLSASRRQTKVSFALRERVTHTLQLYVLISAELLHIFQFILISCSCQRLPLYAMNTRHTRIQGLLGLDCASGRNTLRQRERKEACLVIRISPDTISMLPRLDHSLVLR